MKIRSNFIGYIIPGFLAVCCIAAGLTEQDKTGYIVMALVFILPCLYHYFTNSLSIDGGLITGRTGLFKVKTLSSPVHKIHYCEFTTFLCFNKIKINAITGTYEFKNMGHAQEFVNLVNNEMAK